MYASAVICAGSILGLELWRRYLARSHEVPNWVSIATWVFFAIAAALGATTVFMLKRAYDAVDGHDVESAIRLAESLAYAMNANAASVIALVCVTVLLGASSIFCKRR